MTDTVQNIPLDEIQASFGNDRTQFDESALIALAESIRSGGLLQPVTLRPFDPCYQLIAGERRYRAHLLIREQDTAYNALCGLLACFGVHWQPVTPTTTIRAIVKVMTDKEAAAFMLVENTGRKDLDPIDEARAYKRRMQDFGWSESDVASRAGVTVNTVRNRLKLLAIREDLQHIIRSGSLGIGYAQVMSEAGLDTNRQLIAFKRLQANPSPSVAWFRKECGELFTEQAQTGLFDDVLFAGTAFTATKTAILKPEWKPPADPRKDTAPILGATYQEIMQNQAKFWNEAAEKWDRLGKPLQRDRCLAAAATVIALTAIMPPHGGKGKRVKQNGKEYAVYPMQPALV